MLATPGYVQLPCPIAISWRVARGGCGRLEWGSAAMLRYEESFEKIYKNEKYMNKSQQKHFIFILNSWKQALESEQEKTEQLIQQDQSNFPDSLDRAAKEEEFMLELRKRERERKLILKIDLSLKDIEDDLYGYCETCGIEIGIKRLEARPTATQCIDCKTVDEIKEKQQFG